MSKFYTRDLREHGSGQTLFGRRLAYPRTLREAISTRLSVPHRKELVRILEMGAVGGTSYAKDGKLAEADEDTHYSEHCANMIREIVLSDMSPEDKIAKIKKALKILHDGSEDTEPIEESEGDAEGDGRDVGGGSGFRSGSRDENRDARGVTTSGTRESRMDAELAFLRGGSMPAHLRGTRQLRESRATRSSALASTQIPENLDAQANWLRG